MAKCLAIFIHPLALLALLAGCVQVKSKANNTESIYIESDKIKSVETKSNDINPDSNEPNEFEKPQVDIDSIPTATHEPGHLEMVSAGPNNIEPPRVELDNPKTAQTEPDDLKQSSASSFHNKFAQILKDHVDDKGMVDYETLRRKRPFIKSLLREFDNLDPNLYNSWPKEDKISCWLNAYNIQLLKIITDNYPIKSSRLLRLYPGWGPNSILHIKGIWTDYKFLVMDEEFTLAEIDKRFFRKEFDDPRIFFAISRASLSGPPMRNEPYYGHKLDEQLDDQTKKFLSNPLAFRIEREKQIVYLSSLFQPSSYGKEFLSKFAIDKKFKDQRPTTRAVLNFLINYVDKNAISFLEVRNYSVKFMKYDWEINDGS